MFKSGILKLYADPQPGVQLEVEVKAVSPFVTSDEIHGGGGGVEDSGDDSPGQPGTSGTRLRIASPFTPKSVCCSKLGDFVSCTHYNLKFIQNYLTKIGNPRIYSTENSFS